MVLALVGVLAINAGMTARGAPSPAPAPNWAAAAQNQQAWEDLQTKAVLNGELRAQASYEANLTHVWVSSKRSFKSKPEQAKALQAARLIQRDVGRFCANYCRAEPMPAPELLANGQISFVLSFSGLGRQLFEEELPALLSGSPPLRAAPKPAPPQPAPMKM